MEIKKRTLFVLMASIMVALVSVTGSVLAADLVAVVPDDSTALFELLTVLVGGEQAAQWLTAIGFVCYLLTQLLPWIPVAWLAKLPTWLIRFIGYLAGNYRGTKNECDRTINRTR